MKWQNAVRDFLPATSRSVLISFKGVYHVAFYDREKREFHVTEDGNLTVITSKDNLYWTDVDVITIQNKKDCSILIVEDDVDDQTLLKRELMECIPDLHIDCVYNGEQALSFLLREDHYKNLQKFPDLILLDLNLPKMDGFEVMEEINKHEHLKKIPVFVISTSRNIDQWDRALNLGARCFFNKGTTVADMRKVAHEICLSL